MFSLALSSIYFAFQNSPNSGLWNRIEYKEHVVGLRLWGKLFWSWLDLLGFHIVCMNYVHCSLQNCGLCNPKSPHTPHPALKVMLCLLFYAAALEAPAVLHIYWCLSQDELYRRCVYDIFRSWRVFPDCPANCEGSALNGSMTASLRIPSVLLIILSPAGIYPELAWQRQVKHTHNPFLILCRTCWHSDEI